MWSILFCISVFEGVQLRGSYSKSGRGCCSTLPGGWLPIWRLWHYGGARPLQQACPSKLTERANVASTLEEECGRDVPVFSAGLEGRAAGEPQPSSGSGSRLPLRLPPLRMPAADAQTAAAAAKAAPFLAGRKALNSDSAAEAWLLQHGEAVRLVRRPCSTGGNGSNSSAEAAGWRAAHGASFAAVGAGAAAAPAAAADAAAAQHPTSRPAAPAADAAARAESPGIAAMAKPAGGNISPMRCQWRLQLRDCVDASPAVLAMPAALAGDPQGAPCCRTNMSQDDTAAEWPSSHQQIHVLHQEDVLEFVLLSRLLTCSCAQAPGGPSRAPTAARWSVLTASWERQSGALTCREAATPASRSHTTSGASFSRASSHSQRICPTFSHHQRLSLRAVEVRGACASETGSLPTIQPLLAAHAHRWALYMECACLMSPAQ